MKWAVIPHRYSNNFDVLVRDEIANEDPAAYFMTFVGCEAKPSEKLQARQLLRKLPQVMAGILDGQNARDPTFRVIDSLLGEQSVTQEVLVRAISQVTPFSLTQKQDLEERLRSANVQIVNIPANVLEKTTVEYRISGDVVIRGPISKLREI